MHNILFSGDLVDGVDLQQVKANLSTLFKITDPAKIDALLSGKQVTLKKNLDATQAKKYLAVLHKAGIECRAEPPLDEVSSASDPATTSTASINFNTMVAAAVDTTPASEPTQDAIEAEASHDNPYSAPHSTPAENFDTLAVNDSGSGKEAVLPAEASGLSWGAFFFNWIWGLFNNAYIALLALIPFVGFFVAIWLLFSGRRLAWENKRWESIEHFNRVQKRWGIAGLALFILVIAFYCMLFINALNSVHELSDAARSENAELEAIISETEDPEMREAMRNLNELMKQAEAEAQAYEARDKAQQELSEE